MASDFSVFLSKDQSYFVNGGSTAQQFSAKVKGLLSTATTIGFSTPKGFIEQLIDFVNAIISAFVDAIVAIWNSIVSFVGAIADFVMTVWNNVVGPVLGAAIEAVKTVVTVLFNQISIIIIQPILNGQRTSLANVFGEESFISTINNASPILNEIGTNLGQSISVIDQVTPLMQTMYTAGSIFDGAGTILSPLIMMAGPGIITTLFDLIGTKILDFLISPLLNQIPSSDLENFANSVTSGFGGTETMINQSTDINQKTYDFMIRGKIGTQQFETQNYDTTYQSSSQTSSSCATNDLGCKLSGLFLKLLSFANQTGNILNSGIFSIFDPIIETVLSGFLTILNGLVNPQNTLIVMLGILAMINDLLGGLKPKVPTSIKPFIQLIRVNILIQEVQGSLVRLITSWNSNQMYDGIVSTFWVVKAINSLISETLAAISDLSSVIPALATTLGVVFAEVLNGKSVSDYIYIVRANMAILGSIISILSYLGRDYIFPSIGWINPLNSDRFTYTSVFTGSYFIESWMKRGLYLDKVNSLYHDSNKELYIYIGSSLLDGLQTIMSILGLS